MKIAVDAMGGDFAPAAVVEGAVKASRQHGLDLLLVGRTSEVKPLLEKFGGGGGRIEIVDAPDVIDMHDQGALAVRRKKGSSLVVCAELVRDGRAGGMFTAGNTGAGMAAGTLLLGRIPGIDRAALALPLPNTNGDTILLDAGANVDVGAHCLIQYAVMGSIYAEFMFGINNPRVGLVNIGEEESKGTEFAREALTLLRSAPVNFIGNVEGRDLFNGNCDVAVCDGFTGNVLLKAAEGVAELCLHLIRKEVEEHPMLKIPAGMLKPAFTRIKRRTDYGERGGALLLGVNGVCFIGHGRSNPDAVANAIRNSGEAVRHGIIDKIRDKVAL